MKKIFFIIILIGNLFAETPNWINEPEKACLQSEICVIGEGTGFQTASAAARNEIARFFKTKVVSTFKVTTTSDNQSTDESVLNELEESTDEILEGVVIKSRYESKESVYVLASLDKKDLARRIRNQIKDYDEKLEENFKAENHSSLFKLKKYYNLRETLNFRYEFLSGQRVPEKISFSDIAKLQSILSKGILVSVKFKGEAKEKLKGEILGLLSEVGFRTMPKGGTHQIRGKLSSEKAYLKVKGFEKYSFHLELTSILTKKSVNLGTLNYETNATGRNYEQALEKALTQIRKYMTENIDKLNI